MRYTLPEFINKQKEKEPNGIYIPKKDTNDSSIFNSEFSYLRRRNKHYINSMHVVQYVCKHCGLLITFKSPLVDSHIESTLSNHLSICPSK